MDEDSQQTAALLQRWAAGDKAALAALAPMVYQQLRRLAHNQLQAERPGHTLQSTALVNEAFVRLLAGQPAELQNRAHFVAIASRVMRQILVQYARDRRALKRDGGCRVILDNIEDAAVTGDGDLVVLDGRLCKFRLRAR